MNVTVLQHGGKWVLLQWQMAYSGNLPILSFKIYQLNLNLGVNFTLAAAVTEVVDLLSTFQHNISMGIDPFQYYVFSVEACNTLGCSNMTAGIPSNPVFTDELGKFVR